MLNVALLIPRWGRVAPTSLGSVARPAQLHHIQQKSAKIMTNASR